MEKKPLQGCIISLEALKESHIFNTANSLVYTEYRHGLAGTVFLLTTVLKSLILA